MSTTEQKIKVGNLEWFYREAKAVGAEEEGVVVFLHGLPAQSYTWTVIMPELATKGWRSLAPDWIGSGFSSKPQRRDFDYTPDTFIKALEDLIAAWELTKFSLVVQGFLGSMGIQYALRHPEQIDRLAILNAPLSSNATLPWRMRQLGLPLVGDMLTQDPLSSERILEAGCRYIIAEKDLEVYRGPYLKTSAAGRSLLATVQNLQLKSSLTEIETGLKQWMHPTQIIWGIKDPWLDIDTAIATVKSLAKGELVKIEEAGHYPQEHYSGQVSDALSNFLRREVV
ncbi:alpha/beta fold hydrolase [Merismopedia glauca]|uniref:Hydrolase n=1 Tax=Merismopedia glauca CCAP 1448/3 TaxID=1296344 RepID=A0A2T1C3L4_9CYAN|nr:alpha/beta fold hydrolase [Merismopedia glauca]PSB02841.1 hydrolase [Merismopedia glauca CCAP 1448/3]